MSEANEYIQTYGRSIVHAVGRSGLFPSVMAAQAILESGFGRSTLASEYNNHFGIKAGKSWSGDVVYMSTREEDANGNSYYISAPFRVYETPYDSFRDRVTLLKENKAYERAGVFSARTPEEQAYAIKAAGYATAGNYAEVLVSLIDKYNLRKLDRKRKARNFITLVLVVIAVLVIVALIAWYFTEKKNRK